MQTGHLQLVCALHDALRGARLLAAGCRVLSIGLCDLMRDSRLVESCWYLVAGSPGEGYSGVRCNTIHGDGTGSGSVDHRQQDWCQASPGYCCMDYQ